MSWIEVHQTLPRHPKLIRLAIRLKVSQQACIGYLISLWLWSLDYAENGNLEQFSAEELAIASGWNGDAHEFITSLQEAGWIDNACIHDWRDYAGKLLHRRDMHKKLMRQSRASHKTVTLPPTVPNHTIPNQKTTPLPPKGEKALAGFEEFWKTYPRKQSKGQAEAAWAALKPGEQLRVEILQGVERAKTSDNWAKDGGKFIPYPASWLRAKGWLDVFSAGAENDAKSQALAEKIRRFSSTP